MRDGWVEEQQPSHLSGIRFILDGQHSGADELTIGHDCTG
jgi:hypothetical protein